MFKDRVAVHVVEYAGLEWQCFRDPQNIRRWIPDNLQVNYILVVNGPIPRAHIQDDLARILKNNLFERGVIGVARYVFRIFDAGQFRQLFSQAVVEGLLPAKSISPFQQLRDSVQL